jgi:hypothetical protein
MGDAGKFNKTMKSLEKGGYKLKRGSKSDSAPKLVV